MTDTRVMGNLAKEWTPNTPPPELTLEDRIAQIREIDEQIFRVAGEGSELIARGATVGMINAEAEFLHVLFRRRSEILHEARKIGYEENEFYRR